MNKQIEKLTALVEATGEFQNPAEIARQLVTMAKNVLKSKGQATGIELQSTSEQVFPWESGDGEYRIANLLAIPHWKAQEFMQALQDGDFIAALNCKFSFRLGTDSPVGFGDIVSFKLTEYTNKDGEVGLNVRNIRTERAKTASISLDDLLGMEEEVEAEAEADVNAGVE